MLFKTSNINTLLFVGLLLLTTTTGINTRLTTAEGTVSTLGTNVTTLSNSVGTISTGLATKNTTFVGGTAPTANRAGDIWIDTNSGNELKTWTGSAWTSRRDTTFAKTTDLGTKLNATTSIIQSTVDNKITANAATATEIAINMYSVECSIWCSFSLIKIGDK